VFFVPPAGVKSAAIQNIDAGIKLIVVVTEHVPVHDVMEISEYAAERDVIMIGPTTPGIITVGEAKMGHHACRYVQSRTNRHHLAERHIII